MLFHNRRTNYSVYLRLIQTIAISIEFKGSTYCFSSESIGPDWPTKLPLSPTKILFSCVNENINAPIEYIWWNSCSETAWIQMGHKWFPCEKNKLDQKKFPCWLVAQSWASALSTSASRSKKIFAQMTLAFQSIGLRLSVARVIDTVWKWTTNKLIFNLNY